MRSSKAALGAVVALALTGCAGGVKDGDGYPDPAIVPPNVLSIPDAQPRIEPRSRYGNPADYEVFGTRYFVLTSAAGFRDRGRASWYGTKFHGRRTSSGEPYDMFAMTAAHKTLPLPTYVRVRHLGNGKTVVVKVNDRGPFHQGRIIDLSYAAAARLDIVDAGSAEVEIEAIEPPPPGIVTAAAATPPSPAPVPQFLEVATTDDPIYAVALREDVAGLGLATVEIRSEERGDEVWHRVLVGPFRDGASIDAARQRLTSRRFAPKAVTQ